MLNKNSGFLILSISMLLVLIQFNSCVSVEKIRSGSQAMDRKQYFIAQQLLENEIENAGRQEKAQKSYLLGEAYRLTNQPAEALEWYKMAIRSGLSSNELFWWAGMTSKQTGDYEAAIIYLENIKSTDLIGLDANREIDICKQAVTWQKRGNNAIEIKQLTKGRNGSVYLSDILNDGKLVVTSDDNNGKKDYKWTGRNLSGIFAMDAATGDLGTLSINGENKLQRGYASFNSNETEVILTICGDDSPDENYCRLYSSQLIGERFTEPKMLDFIRPGTNYSHPFLARDSILFFSSNAMDGLGGYDIYFSVKRKERWTKPVNLPSPINTPGNEKFPTMEEDSLYFSSDYLPGLGGLDIFKTYVRSNGEWSPPRNMMPPVNSSMDDFGYFIAQNNNEGVIAYFNSSRNNDLGLDAIFQVNKREISEDLADRDKDNEAEKEKDYKRFLSLRVVEQIFEDPGDPNSRIIGKKPIGGANVVLETRPSAKTRKDGRYITEIAFDSSYQIKVEKQGFLSKKASLAILSKPTGPDDPEIQTSTMEIVLSKIYIDKEIVLENIYYDLDEWFVREDAKPVLNQLALDLGLNEEFNVLIAAHTDCRADDDYNFQLSEKRAQSVVDYLVEKGISRERLSAIGYGKSKMIETCPCEDCTEKEHQKNRRTSFTLKEK